MQLILPLKGLIILQGFYRVLLIILIMSLIGLVINGRFNAIDVFIYTKKELTFFWLRVIEYEILTILIIV